MRGPPAWPLGLLAMRGPLAFAWTPAARAPVSQLQPTGLGPPRLWGAGPGLLAGAGAARGPRRWTSCCPGGGPRGPGGGAGLARLLGLWARSPGALGLPRAVLSDGRALARRAGGQAWRRGPELPAAAADPKEDSRLRPAAAGRSEAQKLLGLAYPERRRLAGRALPALVPCVPLRHPAHLTERVVPGPPMGDRARPGAARGAGRGWLFYLRGCTEKCWTERSPRGGMVKPFQVSQAPVGRSVLCLFG